MHDPLVHIFNAVRSKVEYERLQKAYREHQERERVDDKRRTQQKRDDDFLDFIIEVTESQRRMAELEERMARNYALLQTRYGEDVIGGIAATWLTREEAAGLQSDEERLQALSKKFLNDDDSIKPPYVDLVEAQYVSDWSVLEKLKTGPHAERTVATVTSDPGTKPEVPVDDTSKLTPLNGSLF